MYKVDLYLDFGWHIDTVNFFCFVFVNLGGKCVLCYHAYAYVANVDQAYVFTQRHVPLRFRSTTFRKCGRVAATKLMFSNKWSVV